MALSVPDMAKVNANGYIRLTLLPRLRPIEECKFFYRLVSFPSRTVRLLIRQNWLKTGLPPTAVNLLAKINGHHTQQTLTLLIITYEELCLNTTRHLIASQRTLIDWTVQLLQGSINKATLSFTKRHWACVKEGWTFRTCFGKNRLTTLYIEHNKWLSISLA